MRPWSKYFPTDGEGPWLNSVAHVTHVQSGVNVIAEGRLRAGLVYDHSKLNDKRIQVVWVSPNHWSNGYRYGTVRLDFDWRKLVAGARAYWVEAITKYKPTACRFLITDIDRDSDPLLIRYDPAQDRGPWWYDVSNDQHYWNGEYTLEFMIERDLPVTDATDLSFVGHHPKWCAINNTSCPDGYPTSYDEAAARFLASVVGQYLIIESRLVSASEREYGTMAAAVRRLEKRLRELHKASDVERTTDADMSHAVPLLRAVLGAFGKRREQDAAMLAGLFRSEDALLECFSTIARDIGRMEWPPL